MFIPTDRLQSIRSHENMGAEEGARIFEFY